MQQPLVLYILDKLFKLHIHDGRYTNSKSKKIIAQSEK